MVGLGIKAIKDLPLSLERLEIHEQVLEIFDALLSTTDLEAGDEGPLLDEIVSHFGLSKSHRFEYSGLWRAAREKNNEARSAAEFVPEEIVKKKNPESGFVLPTALLESAPGLVGEMASWITSTAPKPQEALSLAAALCAVGVLKGHRVQTETGLRTNHYLLGIGPSGCGKEHPRRMINLLFRQSGHQHLICGAPSSDSAIYRVLQKSRGRALLQWDEIGHVLKRILSPMAASHTKTIINALLSLWGSANGYFIGNEFADSKSKTVEIDQPCFCLFGTTVPGRFYESLSSDFVADGFLPRFLVLEVADPDVRLRRIPLVEDAPDELVQAVTATKFLPSNVRSKGNLDEHSRIRPAIIGFDMFARRRIEEISEFFEKRKIAARGSGLDEIWNRASEHVQKIALTVCDANLVGEKEVQWSFDLVNRCLEGSCKAFSNHVAESNFERLCNKTKEMISGNPGITRSQLLRKLKIPTGDLQRVCEFLTDSGTAIPQKTSGKASRPSEKWYLKAQESGKMG